MPTERLFCRPSTSTKKKYLSFQPMAVRGCRSIMVLNSYDSEVGVFILCALPFRNNTGPPPIAVFTPLKLGEQVVEMVNTAPVPTLGVLRVKAGPIDRTMISGANFVSPNSR